MKGPVLVLLLLSFLAGCSLPGIYVIDDPLDARQRNELGYVYEQQGKLDLAEREYRLAAKRDRRWAVPWFNLGNVSYKTGDYGRAESHFRQALKRDPDNPDVMNNLAWVLYVQGDRDGALKWVEEAISISLKEEYLHTRETVRAPGDDAPGQ